VELRHLRGDAVSIGSRDVGWGCPNRPIAKKNVATENAQSSLGDQRTALGGSSCNVVLSGRDSGVETGSWRLITS